jgi:hypothetical protein
MITPLGLRLAARVVAERLVKAAQAVAKEIQEEAELP